MFFINLKNKEKKYQKKEEKQKRVEWEWGGELVHLYWFLDEGFNTELVAEDTLELWVELWLH